MEPARARAVVPWRDRPAVPPQQAPRWLAVVIGVVATLLRLVPFMAPGALTAAREYDDAVMFAGAVALVHGRLPYADFVYLHPPGALLLATPAALAAPHVGEATALGLLRILTAVVGGASATLVGLLLRRYGTLAVLAGAGVYATWVTTIAAEQTYLLEPFLNLTLLAALALLALPARGRPGLAGLALGVGLAFKVWGVIDVAILAVAVALAFGRKGLLRYLAGVCGAALVTMLPFFVAAPAAMWNQVVVVQLGRPRAANTSLIQRLLSLNPGARVDLLDNRYAAALAALVILATVLAGVLTAAASLRGRRLGPPEPEVWWTVLAVAHAAVLLVSATFFYHYAAWFAAPFVLVLGAQVGHLDRTVLTPAWGRGRQRTTLAVATVAALVVVGLAANDPPRTSTESDDFAAALPADVACVWSVTPQLVLADRVGTNIENGCDVDIDTVGVGLVLWADSGADSITTSADVTRGNPLWIRHAEDQVFSSDGVMVPPNDHPWLTDAALARLRADYDQVGEVGATTMWVRASR